MVSGSIDKTIRIWDSKRGDCIHVLRGHSRPIESLALSPDGSLVISSSLDNIIKVWEIRRGALLFTTQNNLTVISVFCTGTHLLVNDISGQKMFRLEGMYSKSQIFTNFSRN